MEISKEEALRWHFALQYLENNRPRRLALWVKLYQEFNTALSINSLKHLWMSQKKAHLELPAWAIWEKAIFWADYILDYLLKNSLTIRALPYGWPNFPKALYQIPDAPWVLFTRGDLSALEERYANDRIGVAGTRAPSKGLAPIAATVCEQLVKHRYIIISGLAKGCDMIAHQAALKLGAPTIAALPVGIDQIYPPSHKRHALAILAQGGVLISEYPPQSANLPEWKFDYFPPRYYFVRRNRLIAALAQSLVVLQTPENGGTMHTVAYAQKYQKPIFCLLAEKAILQKEGLPWSGNQKLVLHQKALPFRTYEDLSLALQNQKQPHNTPKSFGQGLLF
jgi:DNA processing protein